MNEITLTTRKNGMAVLVLVIILYVAAIAGILGGFAAGGMLQGILVILCLVSVFYGTEFGFIKESATSLYHAITGTFSEVGETTLKLNADSSREKVFNDLLNDNIAAGRDKAAEQMLAYKEAKLTNSVVGRRSGIFASIAAVVPLQLLAYHVAKLRGCSIDKPKNLAKSVTVE